MSVRNAALFFEKCAVQPKMLARYETMPVPDMLFAASCEGFTFNVEDLGKLIGGMEARHGAIVSALEQKLQIAQHHGMHLREVVARIAEAKAGAGPPSPSPSPKYS